MVAALTMPNLIANYQELQTVAKLRKTFSTLQNAYNILKLQEHDGMDLDKWENPKKLGEELSKHLKTSKYCPSGKGFECYTSYNSVKNIFGRNITLDWAGKPEGIMLNDGTTLLINNFLISDTLHFSNTGLYAQIFVDINSKKNQMLWEKISLHFTSTKAGLLFTNQPTLSIRKK